MGFPILIVLSPVTRFIKWRWFFFHPSPVIQALNALVDGSVQMDNIYFGRRIVLCKGKLTFYCMVQRSAVCFKICIDNYDL